eukprot:scaffold324008_cov68-Tisochrysis_lutea.AAC.3
MVRSSSSWGGMVWCILWVILIGWLRPVGRAWRSARRPNSCLWPLLLAIAMIVSANVQLVRTTAYLPHNNT